MTRPIAGIKSVMGERLADIAAAPGVRDALSLNIWTEGEDGQPQSEPGLLVPISYRRADGQSRLKGQLGGNVRKKDKMA